jgi:hypothetical protein
MPALYNFYNSHIPTSSKCLGAASKLKRPAKGLTAALLIAAFAVIIFAVPFLIGKEIPTELLISALIPVSIYVILSLEIMHRSSIALLGAIVIVSCLIIKGQSLL